MANPTLYKKLPLGTARQRTTTGLTAEEQSSVNNTVNKFFDLFKAEHL